MSFEQAIQTIIELNKEISAIEVLMRSVKSNIELLEKYNAEMSFCLRTVKKINGGKNEVIDALCEKE